MATTKKRHVKRWSADEVREELVKEGIRSFLFDPEVGVRDASNMDHGVLAVALDGSEIRGTDSHRTILAAALVDRAWAGGKYLPAMQWQGTRAVFTCDIG